jgi:hypothetical protein
VRSALVSLIQTPIGSSAARMTVADCALMAALCAATAVVLGKDIASGGLAEAPELRRNLSAAARVRAQAFDFDRAVQSYEQYYSNLAAISNVRQRNPGVQCRGATRTPVGDCA